MYHRKDQMTNEEVFNALGLSNRMVAAHIQSKSNPITIIHHVIGRKDEIIQRLKKDSKRLEICLEMLKQLDKETLLGLATECTLKGGAKNIVDTIA